jgi:hypothetical protein
MPDTLFSARDTDDIAALGSLNRFSDGTPEPPARHRPKRTAWLSDNGATCLVRKKPADHISGPSFALHLGNVGATTLQSSSHAPRVERTRARQHARLTRADTESTAPGRA